MATVQNVVDTGQKFAPAMVLPSKVDELSTPTRLVRSGNTAIPKKIRDKAEGKEFTAPTKSTIGYSFDVEGVKIQLDADQLTLSNYNGMLMADGTVTVS